MTKKEIETIWGNERGVTLIESLVYLVIAGMLLGTAVTAFLGQNKTYNRQDVVTEIQQNVRGTIALMAADIRLAGMGLAESTKLAFSTAQPEELELNYIDEAGENVKVKYTWDDNLKRLFRKYGNDVQEVLAENIEHIRFEYLYKNPIIEDPIDHDDPDPWIWATREETIVAALFPPGTKVLDKIRAVRIVVLGAARESVFNQTDPATYNPPHSSPAGPNDPPWDPIAGTGFKRMTSTIVQCRNNLES